MNTGAMLTDHVGLMAAGNAVADTVNETKSSVVDLRGIEGVVFLVKFADVDPAAVLTFTVKENTANSTTSPTPTAVALTGADITGLGSIVSGALVITEDTGNLDNKIVAIDVRKAAFSKDYGFLSITVADESYEIGSIEVLTYGGRSLPPAAGTGVASIAKFGK